MTLASSARIKTPTMLQTPANLKRSEQLLPSNALSAPVVDYAFEQLHIKGLPISRQNERWKYSSLAGFWQSEYFHPCEKIDGTLHAALDPAQEKSSPWHPKNPHTLRLYNGAARNEDVAQLSKIAGLKISSFETYLQSLSAEQRAKQSKKLQSLADIDGLCATTIGLSKAPLVLQISPSFDASRPLEILHQLLPDNTSAPSCLAAYSTLYIDVAPQAAVTLTEQYQKEQAAGLSSVLTLISLGQGSSCQHTKLFIGQHAKHQKINYTRILQARDSRYTSGSFSIGEGFIRHAIEPMLLEPGTLTQLNGAYLALGNHAHHDHRLFTDHLAGHCQSKAFYKGIIGQGATAVFNGRIHIATNAAGSDGALENRNLLLDAQSTVNTKPELEIYNDDVKCSHGATVSQISPDQLLYLRARGLDKTTATRLLMESYLLETLQSLPDDMTEGLNQWLFQTLHDILVKAPIEINSVLAPNHISQTKQQL